MKLAIFGATGMVGQGALRECLRDARVDSVLTVGRTAVGQQDPKLRDLVSSDLWRLDAADFVDVDACLFCLGVSSAGMNEDDYREITYDLTIAIATTLAGAHPNMTFCFVSGAGTDSSEAGRIRWARIKGRTENALLKMPLRAFMFRPGFIQPLHGIVSKTPIYRVMYAITGPLLPLLRRAFPRMITTTEQVGRALVEVALNGWSTPILENPDINAAAERQS